MVSFNALFAIAALSTAVSALPRPSNHEVELKAPSYGEGSPERVSLRSSSTEKAKPTQTSYGGYSGQYGSEYGSEYESDDNKYRASSSVQHTSAPETTRHSTTASASTVASTSVHTSAPAPTYGSGKSNWGDYDECVKQCVNDHGAPPKKYVAPTQEKGLNEPKGDGRTHIVIVAPQQGVFRMVPVNTQANVGDVIRFQWGANNHTIVKGSPFNLCNKTADSPFATTIQQKDFVFDLRINDTETLYFFCSVGQHCRNGMFGTINGKINVGGNTTVGALMDTMKAKNPSLAAADSYAQMKSEGNQKAREWGQDLDVSALPDWAQERMLESVAFTRATLAMNPETLTDDGSIDFSLPLMLPEDISGAINNAASAPSSSSASPTGASTTSATAAGSETTTPSNGAATATASRLLVASIVVFVTFLSL